MRLATCSFQAFRTGMGLPVRITLGIPRYAEPEGRQHWIYLAELAPRGWYFRMEGGKFDRNYLRQLDRLAGDIERKLEWLGDLSGSICLLCYERRISGPADCHRRLFADWWTPRTGEEVPELDGK